MTEKSGAPPVSLGATPLAAAVRLDRDPEPQEIVQRAAMQLVLEGQEPFVWWTWLGAPCDPVELLPPDVTPLFGRRLLVGGRRCWPGVAGITFSLIPGGTHA